VTTQDQATSPARDERFHGVGRGSNCAKTASSKANRSYGAAIAALKPKVVEQVEVDRGLMERGVGWDPFLRAWDNSREAVLAKALRSRQASRGEAEDIMKPAVKF